MTGAAWEADGKQITTRGSGMSGTPVTLRGRVAAALVVVYVAWGSTFIAMRVAVRSLPPLTMSGLRFLAAGLLLYCWCWWQRRRRPEAGWRSPTRREWRASAILGLALPAAGTGGLAWAEQKIPACTAALLLASIPVWMTITSRIVYHERISVRTAGGLALGLAGVVVLINPLAARAPDLLHRALRSAAHCAGAAGRFYAKPADWLAAAGQRHGDDLRGRGIARLIGAAGGELGRISAASLISDSGLALGYLIVFGSLLGYSTDEWLLHHASTKSSPAPMRSPARSSRSSWPVAARRADQRAHPAGRSRHRRHPHHAAPPKNQDQGRTKQATSPADYRQQRSYLPLTGISADTRPTTRPAAEKMNQARSAAATGPPHEPPDRLAILVPV